MAAPQFVKATIKRAVKGGARLVGALRPPACGVSRILTYHSVGQRRHEMNVAAAAFREQMRWLADHTHVITLAEAAQGTPGIAITFDDGFQDNLLHAAPVLAELRLPATVFLVAGRMGDLLDNEPDPPNGRLLTWDEARELKSMGIELGAHTLNHVRLSAVPEEQQRVEILGCQTEFEEHLGASALAFAYPFGSALDYDNTSIRLVHEAGFQLAVSNRYGFNRPGDDPFVLRRIWIDATDSQASFRAKAEGRLDLLRLLDSDSGTRLRRRLNQALRL